MTADNSTITRQDVRGLVLTRQPASGRVLTRQRAVPGATATNARFADGAGVVGTDPESLASLVEYLDARDLSGTYADGDLVPTWASSLEGGTGTDATQATTGKQPRWRANGLASGLPAVKWDGVDDSLQWSVTSNSSTSWTMMFLVRTSDAAHYLFDSASGRVVISAGEPGNGGASVFDGIWHQSNDASILDDAPHLVTVVADFGANTLRLWDYKTRLVDDTGYLTGKLIGGTGALGTRYTGASQPLEGEIAAVWLFDEALSDAAREAVADYIADDWGITL